MCDNVCIEVNETIENISIEVRDFSVLNIISEDANNSAITGSDGLLYVPESSNVSYANQTEVNAGVIDNKSIAPNTLAGWWIYVKTLAQTFTQKITFNLGALFTPQTAPTHERGRIYFDDVNDCISFMDNISGTSVQVGYEVLMRARNNTGATIANGSVVYISGAIGQNSTVALAQANTLPTSEIIGIATHDIANNTVGKICVFGLVNDLNTNSFTDGQMLYLSTSIAGGLTSTIPESPNFVVNLGVVEHAHPTQGKILVRPQRALANDNSLGTAQNIAPTQNAVKSYVDAQKPYKVYTALLTQNGTNAPTAIVLENTLGGEVIWNYEDEGLYSANLSNGFTDLTFVQISNGNMNGFISYSYKQNINSIFTETYSLSSGSTENSALNKATIEIRVYN